MRKESGYEEEGFGNRNFRKRQKEDKKVIGLEERWFEGGR